MALTQKHFRFGSNDGDETNHGWLGIEDADITCGPGAGATVAFDTTFLLRFGVFSSANANNIDFTFQYRINGGSYTNITTTSTHVKTVDGVLTNGGNCTQRLTGQGTFQGGTGQTEDGTSGGGSMDIASGGCAETIITLQVVGIQVKHGDVIDFQLLQEGSAMDSYEQTPTITVNALVTKSDGDPLPLGVAESQSVTIIAQVSSSDVIALGVADVGRLDALQIKLYQTSTLIATAAPALTTSLADGEYTLSGTELAAISDWTALRATLVANGRQGEVSWLELETPAASSEVTPKSGEDDAVALGVVETGDLTSRVITDSDPIAQALAEGHEATGTMAVEEALGLGVVEADSVSATMAGDEVCAVVVAEEQQPGASVASDDPIAVVVVASAAVLGAFTEADWWSVGCVEADATAGSPSQAESIALAVAEALAVTGVVAPADDCALGIVEDATTAADVDQESDDTVALVVESSASLAVVLAVDDATALAIDTQAEVAGSPLVAEVVALGAEETGSVSAAATSADTIAGIAVEDQSLVGVVIEQRDDDVTLVVLAEEAAISGTPATDEQWSVVVAEDAAILGTTTSDETLALPLVESGTVPPATADKSDGDVVVVQAVEAQTIIVAVSSADVIALGVAEAGARVGLTVVFYEGSDEVFRDPDTSVLTTGMADFERVLTAGEKASISNWAILKVSLIADGRQVEVAFLEVEAPAVGITPKSGDDPIALPIVEAVPLLDTETLDYEDADPVALGVVEGWDVVADEASGGASDTMALGVAEDATFVQARITEDTLVAVAQEALAGTATGDLLDALVAYLVEDQTAVDSTATADKTSDDVIEAVLAAAFSGTGVVTQGEAISALLEEIHAGSADVTVEDFCAAVVTDALAGAATITVTDDLILALVDALTGGDLATAASSDELAAVIEEALSGESASALASADEIAVQVADALVVSGAVDASDLLVPVLAEAIEGAGVLTSQDDLAAILEEAYVLTFGLTTAEGADDLGIGFAEAQTYSAALAVSDALVALLGDETLTSDATITVTDDIVGVLQEAMIGDGAVSAADVLPVRLLSTMTGTRKVHDEDRISVVIVERGAATVVMPLTAFLVGTLVVTWPTYALASQFAEHGLANKTDGWPYTLVQKVE